MTNTEPLFAGLKVIDCGSYIAGPASTTIMADLGADVIKIEPPGAGDPYRKLPKLPGNPISEHDYAWILDSHSKRGLALDLGTAEGQAVLHDLVAGADVFVTNYPLRVRDKLKIDHPTLAGLNETLIYASFTGYGEVGPEVGKPGFDATSYWARSGMMDIVRSSATAVPARAAIGQGDHPSAMSLYAAIATALYQRERTGRGALVSSSLLANGLWSNSYMATAALCGATFTPRPPREETLNPLSCYYQCNDAKWLMLAVVNEAKQWPILVNCLGRDDLLTDERFASPAARFQHGGELIAILDEAFAGQNRAHWERNLRDAGIVFDIVATPDDIVGDEQVAAAGITLRFADDDRIQAIGTPFRLGDQPPVSPRMPPAIGEHTDEVLTDIGYDVERIASLRSAGVIA